MAGDSCVAFDSQGRLFWTYLGANYAGVDVWICQCDPTTGMALAGYPIDVTASAGINMPAINGYSHDKPWLAVDSFPGSPNRDHIYVAWTYFDTSYTTWIPHILSSVSDDQGATWVSSVELSAPSDGWVQCAQNAVAMNGDVYVGYHARPGFGWSDPLDGTSAGVFVCKSADGGTTYPNKNMAFGPGQSDITYNFQHFGAAIPGARYITLGSFQPWILPDPLDANKVCVIACDDPDNNLLSGDAADVYAVRSLDSGATWDSPTEVANGPSGTFQLFPTAAVDRVNGAVSVMWYDNRSGKTNASGDYLLDVYVTTSADGGHCFGPDTAINDVEFDPNVGAPIFDPGPPPTTRIGEYNGIAVQDGIFVAVWTQDVPSIQDVFFDTGNVSPSLTIHVPADASTIQAGIDASKCAEYVVLVAPGYYSEQIDFNGKALTVKSSDGPTVTTIDGQDKTVVRFESGEGPASVLSGFTISGGDKGGISCLASSPTITNNFIVNCKDSAIDCRGEHNVVASPTIVGNVFSANSAREHGAAIHCDTKSAPWIERNTFSNNTVRKKGGAIGVVSGSTAVIRNSILWHDFPDEIYVDSSSSATVSFSDVEGGHSGAGNVNVDPHFVDPANARYQLRADSPCIDSGDTAIAPDEEDADGNPRFLDGNLDRSLVVDMGAYEFCNVHLSLTGQSTPGGTMTLDTTGTASLPVFLWLGLGRSSVRWNPYGYLCIDLTQYWSLMSWGVIPNSVDVDLPVDFPVPIVLHLQEVALSGRAGNLSNCAVLEIE